VFTEPLKNACVIPEKDIRTMFPKQLLAMKNGHEKFMNELDERLNNWKWQGVLGDIFAKLGNSYHVSGSLFGDDGYVCLYVCLFVCLFVCLLLYFVLFATSFCSVCILVQLLDIFYFFSRLIS
jgi:hypothetical protein